MEEEKSSSRVSSSFAPAGAPPLPPSPATDPASAPADHRRRFSVELRPGETTIVSWKRLLRDSDKAAETLPPEPPSGSHPTLESRIAPASAPAGQAAEGELNDAVPPPNRFSAVIEKIEHLYMGQQSSDEEKLDNIPDDDEYDTEDSFIDDTELDEYFQVDKAATKHNGFFVNRGKLERINEPITSANHAQKKRRKDLVKAQSELDDGNVSNKHVKMGNMRMKAAVQNVPLVVNKSLNPSKMSSPLSEHCQVGKSLNSKLNSHNGRSKKKPVDSTVRGGSFLPMEGKGIEKQKTGAIYFKDLANKLKVTSASSDAMHLTVDDKVTPFQVEQQYRNCLNYTNERDMPTKAQQREKNGSRGFSSSISSGSKHLIQTEKSPSMPAKEGSGFRPKGTMLERAIRDLENVVAESRPPTLEMQEADPLSQGVKRRLPREVKLKLAKVARLAQSSQGRISEELINRLMSFLGHLVQLRTLKRNLKAMVKLGLSAKQQKDDRFQQIKREVIEMIRMHAFSSKFKLDEQQGGSSNDFTKLPPSDEKGTLRARFSMDDKMEDKICDLYDLYVEGMDEDKGPQIRKLYVELAELWPNGSMDNTGIKSAINRAKGRRALYLRHKERVKRKQLLPVVRAEDIAREDGNSNAKPRPVQEKLAIDSTSHASVFTSSERPFMNLTADHHPSTSGWTSNQSSFAPKVKGSMAINEAGHSKDAAILEKNLKRKQELDLGDIHDHHEKLSLSSQHHDNERINSHVPATSSHKLNLQSAILPGFEKPN